MSHPALAQPNVLELTNSLWASGAVTLTQMTLPDGLDYDTFEALGAYVGTVRRAGQWWTGDWLNFGERTYEERMEQAALATGLSESSLQNVKSICRRVPPQVRRANVPFSTHAEVTSLDPVDQDRWLRLAEERGWTKMGLREEIRGLPLGGSSPIMEPATNLQQVALELVHAGKQYGADGFLVPRHSFVALALAVGEDL